MSALGPKLGGDPRSRPGAAALGAIALVAVAIGIIVGAGLPGSSKGASTPAKGSGSTTVQRRDLVATDTEAGTLSYANPQTVFNRVSGTITSLPKVGTVIKPGQALYTVDGAPVVLFSGPVPAYRTLSEGVSDGLDVQQLKQNLVSLGFDPSHQITINQTFDAATASAVDDWQSSLGETQTGTVSLGQVVFLPGPQRITAVDTVLGSTGGAGGGSASSGSSAAAGTSTGASTNVVAPRAEFVSLTTTTPSNSLQQQASGAATASSSASADASGAKCPAASNQQSTTPTQTTPGKQNPNCQKPVSTKTPSAGGPTTLAALLALLKAETLELQKSRTAASTGAAASSAASAARSATSSRASGLSSVAGSGAASGSSGGSASGGSSAATGAATAQAILQTTSTQLVVSVNLDATKQSEAVVGEPVTVQMPDGSTVDGKITQVSPVAQSSSSSSSGAAAGGGGATSTPSSTVPVTITLSGHERTAGLDQAAVSVNFQQQKANNVLSVPVTALLATAGGGYAVQSATPPHNLIPVTPPGMCRSPARRSTPASRSPTRKDERPGCTAVAGRDEGISG